MAEAFGGNPKTSTEDYDELVRDDIAQAVLDGSEPDACLPTATRTSRPHGWGKYLVKQSA
jgi:hypothetical protein